MWKKFLENKFVKNNFCRKEVSKQNFEKNIFKKNIFRKKGFENKNIFRKKFNPFYQNKIHFNLLHLTSIHFIHLPLPIYHWNKQAQVVGDKPCTWVASSGIILERRMKKQLRHSTRTFYGNELHLLIGLNVRKDLERRIISVDGFLQAIKRMIT